MKLTPAYGRDYTSKREVIKAFKTYKDFIIADFLHPYSGKPCNKRDLMLEGVRSVQIRYSGLRKVVVVEVK